jgi:CBS domain containing-hemolysin-like protein
VWILDVITGAIFKLLGADKDEPDKMTESELLTVVDVSHEDGVIEPEAHFMISNVVDFGDAVSKDIMIPRADVVFADIYSSYDELVELFKNETYSRIPIYQDSKDHVIGVLYLKDLFFYRETNDMDYFDLKSILREPLFVFEYQKTSQIFTDMKAASCSIAVVLDEYGICSGIITMEDLVEEIVGEIRDEYDADEADFIREVAENIYDIDASMKLDDVNDVLDTDFHSEDYDSIGGFVIELLDKLPSVNEEAIYENVIFKVMKVNRNRIERVLLTLLPKDEDNPENEAEPTT